MDERIKLIKKLLDVRYKLKDLDLYDKLTDFIESISEDFNIDSYVCEEEK